jgi:hypothetical protein
VDAREAETVRDIVHQYLCESVGFKAIAKRLRERGIPRRRQSEEGERLREQATADTKGPAEAQREAFNEAGTPFVGGHAGGV